MLKNFIAGIILLGFMQPTSAQDQNTNTAHPRQQMPQVKTVNGMVEGQQEASGIFSFKGIPYAAPPVGNLRWKEPQPVQNWKGFLQAKRFGPRAMQPPIFSDMVFRSNGMSEDCLYLNIWSPDTKAKLPVLVYFYGGGFVAGDGSEPRYDGENMATKGIVTLTVNYRLGLFGLFAHPELSKESPHHASGNYGLMDQAAALQWVRNNISSFGGDPSRVTIAGESAGSISVSALMASPLSKNLIAGAIGESGSILGALPPVALEKAEENGRKFGEAVGAKSLASLRAMNADSLLAAATKFNMFRFSMTVDGYVFPKEPLAIFQSGEEAKVPLLAGWNSQESNFSAITGSAALTKENYEKAVQKLYGAHASEILKQYQVNNDADVEQVATDMASDRFIAFSTWRWTNLHAKTGQPVYRYFYERPRPALQTTGNASGNTTQANGAVHSAEIEYAMGNLPYNKVYSWKPEDFEVSKTMEAFFANFIKTGNPNGANLPQWPSTASDAGIPVMHINVQSKAMPDAHAGRYNLLEQIAGEHHP